MESAEALGEHTVGNGNAALGTQPAAPGESAMKRDQDSTDDFEHLEAAGRREEGESPLHRHAAARALTQNFLDMERDERPTPSPPAVAPSQPDHIADKFTDSESDAGESPLHRPQPPNVSAPVAPPPPVPQAAPAPEGKLELSPVASQPVPEVHEFEIQKPEPMQPPKEPTPPPRESTPLPKEPIPVLREPTPPKEPTPPPKEPTPPREPTIEPKPTPPEPKPVPTEPKPQVAAARGPVAHIIEAEVIFCQMGLDAWFDPQRLHPKVESLIYWRNAARSGVALGCGLALLVALACCSVVSVLAYASLLALCAAVAFRIYKNVLQAVQKTNDGHPFKWLLEKDISVPVERSQSVAAAATAHLNAAANELRRLFLVEDLVDSLKFGVLLWCLTYVGACFNGITLIILGWIALFTLPKAYEMNKAQVDANLELARAKINEISAKVRAAVPLGRKTESDKDK